MRRTALILVAFLTVFLTQPVAAGEPAVDDNASSRLRQLSQGWQRQQGYGPAYELVQAALAGMQLAWEQGRVDEARNILERAASTVHAVEIEMGLIQTLMRAGEYKHALSAAAHTHAEHRDDLRAGQLYAQLLNAGGHRAEAELVGGGFAQVLPLPPTREPTSDCNTSGGWLFDDGRRAVALLPGAALGQQLTVRSGRGTTTTAEVERVLAPDELVVLRLAQPLPVGKPLPVASQAAAPGRPVYLVGYEASAGCAGHDWPRLVPDILGMPNADQPGASYKIHSKLLSIGAGIVDKNGAMLGFVLRGERTPPTLLPLQTFRSQGIEFVGPQPDGVQLSTDDIYEGGLSWAVQIQSRPAD